MGISPDKAVPSWDGSAQNISALSRAGNDLGGGLAGSMQETVGGIGGAILNGLNGIFTGGPFAPAEEAALEIRNGQMDLQDAVNFLTGLPGYIWGYMGRNISAEWAILGNNVRRMPFDKQLGPVKNAHIDKAKERVVLDGVGAWLVIVKSHARGSAYGGNGMIQQTVRVRRPNGQFYHQCIDDFSTFSDTGFPTNPKGAGTALSIFPVVIDEPGCFIEVETWTGAWRWWDGGYRYSMCAALRFSTDVENKGEETVRDETREEANKG